MGFLAKVEAQINLEPTMSFRQRVEAKYTVAEMMDKIKIWAKRLLGGLIATMIFSNAALGMTLQNPKDVGKVLEDSIKGGGYQVVVDDRMVPLDGGDNHVQKVTFKVMKDGQYQGKVTYTGLETYQGEKVTDKDMETDDFAGPSHFDRVDHDFDKGRGDGLTKDVHLAILTAKLALEQKTRCGDPDGTKEVIQRVAKNTAADYAMKDKIPVAKEVKKVQDKKVAHEHKDTKKTGHVSHKKMADEKAKSGALDKHLKKSVDDTKKNVEKIVDKTTKDVKQGAKKLWDSSKSYLNKLANR